MQIVVVIALALVVVAGIMNRSAIKSDLEITTTPTITNTVIPTPTESSEEIILNTPMPTTKPTITLRPTSVQQINISSFIYPGLKEVSPGKYESADSPDQITKWYEDVIRSQGYSINTFVKTNSNDNILNKLVGAKSGVQLQIEIIRKNGSTITTVTVLIDK